MKMFNFFQRVNLFKSLYISYKYRSKILIGWNVLLLIDKNAKILALDKNATLEIGLDYFSSKRTILELRDESKLCFSGKVKIMKGNSIVVYSGANFSLGNKTFINENSNIRCEKSINIGNNVAVSWGVTIMDTNMHDIFIDNKNIERNESVIIGDNNLVGCHSIILKGTHSKENVIFSAGSIMKSKRIMSNSIVFGEKVHSKESIKWR